MKIYACFYHETERSQEHATVYRLLNSVLKREYGITEYIIDRNSHGKPVLISHPAVRINLSHCRGLAVCAVGFTALGVDCEQVRSFREGVVRRVCTMAEAEYLHGCKERDLEFTRLWTLKESFVKAIGVGISYPMKRAAFDISGDSICSSVKGASFRQYVIADRYIISACAAEPDRDFSIEFITEERI